MTTQTTSIVPADEALKKFVAEVAAMTDIPQAVANALADIEANLTDAYNRASADPEAQTAIQATWNSISMIADMVTRVNGVIAGSASLVQSIAAQRDKALEELQGFVKAVKNGDVMNPLIRDLAEDITDEWSEAFWESLPYDLGQILHMDYYDADLLYTAITLDTSYEFPDVNEHGVSADALETFRSQLRDLLIELRQRSWAEALPSDDEDEDTTETDEDLEENF